MKNQNVPVFAYNHYIGISIRLYVNGKENLLTYGKSQQLLTAIFDKTVQFKIMVRELVEPR